jgi:hypothetical protein
MSLRERPPYSRVSRVHRKGLGNGLRRERPPYSRVSRVVDMVAEGISDNEILEAYPDLEAEDVRGVAFHG